MNVEDEVCDTSIRVNYFGECVGGAIRNESFGGRPVVPREKDKLGGGTSVADGGDLSVNGSRPSVDVGGTSCGSFILNSNANIRVTDVRHVTTTYTPNIILE